MSDHARTASIESLDDLLTDEQREALTSDLQEIAARRRRAVDAAATIPLRSSSGSSREVQS